MTTRIYLQPLPVRIWHWLNALGIVTLCLTGAQIRFPEYVPLFGSYRGAIMLHNTAGICVALSFSIWFFYYKLASNTMEKIYIPTLTDLKLFPRQVIFYFFAYFFGVPNPHHATPDNKFNPLQKSAYLAIMFVLVPLVSLTGILLMNVAPLREMVVLAGGLKILVAAHFLLACSLCAFLFTHVYLATLGKTPLAYWKPMWTGWEDVEEHGQTAKH
ncbi:cytochrome b/b6 domain-containing protein [Geobacter sp. SVR]|uniref:cytochrome b/b6 domain-containing protein n=1 Tax=Geobacter sp. SVR TaxID=2495594 RepID=UPI00143EFDDC|nr:cytochrome b/b6 domain-containing protein [Geobacter sp. SVR]BCS54440.1 cytochrome b [Geobacter sp. SVR]GCF87672.1 cytochrome b [Geobacter sp. SVR]